MSEKYKMYLVLGDWSNDGHGKTDKILVETNYPVEKIKLAYKKAVKKTNIIFDHKTNEEQVEICTEYEDSKLNIEAQKLLTKFNIQFKDLNDIEDEDEFYLGIEEYKELWFRFIKTISLPDLEYSFPVEDIPCINGYWDKTLNVTFGYGLY